MLKKEYVYLNKPMPGGKMVYLSDSFIVETVLNRWTCPSHRSGSRTHPIQNESVCSRCSFGSFQVLVPHEETTQGQKGSR
jgi:hypothetical protein